MKNSLLIFIAMFLMIACGGSESSDNGSGGIYGTVRDYATGDPVSGANVQLRPGGETTLTDADGMFEFIDLNSGQYSLGVSKVEYTDLVDDHLITVKDRKVRYDLRIKKVMEEVVNLDILDNNGNPITELDFGEELISKQFQIYNAGPDAITCQVVYKADWVSGVSASYAQVEPGDALPVVVTIDRSRLAAGENRTSIQVTSNNGNKSLQLIATKDAEPPVVKTLPVTDAEGNTVSSFLDVFHAEVIAVGNPSYTERGFCYSSENSTPDEYDICVFVPGTGLGEYEYTNWDLYDSNTTRYYVRAYLRWNKSVVYGNVESFIWYDVN